MKVAPLHRAFCTTAEIESVVVHTGQHYDAKMSAVFFEQLELPQPNYFLGVGGGSHTEQTAKTMLALEPVLTAEKPDWVLVVGDVNATLAATLVAVKMGIKVAHVEAGLRSGDRQMPEELNRLMTDAVSDLLFVTEQAGVDNLLAEGVAPEKIQFVGNCMIDSLLHYIEKAQALQVPAQMGLQGKPYVLVTMHRPANVDHAAGLQAIVSLLHNAAKRCHVVFAMHPRTQKNLAQLGLLGAVQAIDGLILTEPLGYLEFLGLMAEATVVLTDSGGIQEETTFLKVPCLTFRDTTERPCTVALGTNILLSDLDPVTALTHIDQVLHGQAKQGTVPPLWDGKAAERIANYFIDHQ
jgi:UDP-N-acetylglucosamine 2-epimerase (non-hydrolysing)